MSLPRLKHPTYKITLPSNNKKVSFRPFLVGEEKILLMAMESNDMKEIITAVEEIIKACCITKIDVLNMPILDVEYFFLQLRAKSKGEVLELKYTCHECETPIDFDMNIEKVKIKKHKNHTNKIIINNKIGFIMKYPTLNMAGDLLENEDKDEDNKSSIENHFNMLKLCIDYVYDEESIYHLKDETDEEIEDFINNLNEQAIIDATNFINTAPEVIYDVELECNKCKWKDTITIKGLQNFFV